MLHPKPSLRLEPGSWVGPATSQRDAERREVAPRAVFEPQDQAERIVVRFLRLCEHPLTSKRMLALVNSILEGDETGLRVIRLVNLVVGSRPAQGSALQEAVLRRQLVGVILAGVGAGRYLRLVEPIASASEEQVVTLVAPAIRAALAKPEKRRTTEPRPELAALPSSPADPELEEPMFAESLFVEQATAQLPQLSDSWFDDFHEFEDETIVLPRAVGHPQA